MEDVQPIKFIKGQVEHLNYTFLLGYIYIYILQFLKDCKVFVSFEDYVSGFPEVLKNYTAANQAFLITLLMKSHFMAIKSICFSTINVCI